MMKIRGMKLLITGATGFLGRNLVSHLLSNPKMMPDIIVVGRSLYKLNNTFNDFVTKKETDYSFKNLIKITKGVDVVIHLASQLMQKDTDALKLSQFSDNFNITENILLAAHHNQVGQFINCSSISVYPLRSNLSEKEFLKPSNIYGVSKAGIESYLAYFQNETDMNIVSLRLARLYGVGDRGGLMFTDFISKATKGCKIIIYGTGSATVDYLYIKDAVEVFERIIYKFRSKGIFNVGRGRAFAVKEIAESISRIFGNEVVYLENRPEGAQGSVMNVSKINNELGWKATWDLESSILDIKKIIENEK